MAGMEVEAGGDTPPICEIQHTEETIEVSDKRAHVGTDTESVAPETGNSPAMNITPQPRAKMPIKRRTLSPNVGSEKKRIKTVRTSLPATLSQDQEPVKIVSEWKFAPLKAVVGERVRRLLQLQADETTYSQKGGTEDDGDNDDENMLVLDSNEDITYPLLPELSTPFPTGRAVNIAESSSERSAVCLRAGWDAERQRFHDAILALQQEADRAKADLQILSIEVESLRYTEGGSSPLDVIKSIRESFGYVHEFLGAYLPSAIHENMTNQDLLEILVANVREFADRLRIADRELVEKGTLCADLGNQVHALVDRLAEKEVQRQQSQELLNARHIEMQDVKADLEQAESDNIVKQDELNQQIAKAEQLESEKTGLQISLDRLTTSLENYQREESRLTELINKMEHEHRTTVSNMNAEREQTVRDLENNLDNEIERGVALAARFRDLQGEHEMLVDKRDNLQAEVDETAIMNEIAQAKLAESQAAIEDLDGRIYTAEDELTTLQEQIVELRKQNTAERQQRETAETELDECNDQIDELNRKLHEQGKEANELRLKSHELQASNQNRIATLQQQMSDQDAQFQADIANEVQRREATEQMSQNHESKLKEVTEKLAAVEKQMGDLVAKRDTEIQDLEHRMTQETLQIQDLQDKLAAAKEECEAQIDENTAKASEYEKMKAHLEQTISNLQHKVDEREDKNQDLHTRLASLEVEKHALQQENNSLERRVESEAEQMLQTTNDYLEQVEGLEQQLITKQKAIGKVEKKSAEAEKSWTQLVEMREHQVDALMFTATQRDDTITLLREENESLHNKLKAYIRRSTNAIEEMQRQLDIAKVEVDAEADALKADGEAELAELDATDVPNHQPQIGEVEQAVKKTRGRKRRAVDSAIGLDEGGEESLVM